MQVAEFAPARDENDQPRYALIAAYEAMVDVGNINNANAVLALLQQRVPASAQQEEMLLTDEIAVAIYG
jgi:hypothetical protein